MTSFRVRYKVSAEIAIFRVVELSDRCLGTNFRRRNDPRWAALNISKVQAPCRCWASHSNYVSHQNTTASEL